jgi:heme/copper-type cytochrome/quinol oxidase subunit 2
MPSEGFLIVASKLGFNDSLNHGAPTTSWPVITVHQGQQVNIVVCNNDVEAHGFQITHYLESSIESVAPGQAIHLSLVADRQGNFDMYCSIFCSIHPFMQNGLLKVVP